jgi:hypothetical protein
MARNLQTPPGFAVPVTPPAYRLAEGPLPKECRFHLRLYQAAYDALKINRHRLRDLDPHRRRGKT